MRLDLHNIKLRYHDISFAYSASISSPITGVFGQSGSGKTTLMNIISGISKPQSGELVFNEQVLFCSKKNINTAVNKRNIGVVFQEHFLFPHLNVKQNLNYSKLYQKDRPLTIHFDSVVKLLQVEHLLKKKPKQLSGGERQRVAIGRTLLSQPDLLLLDEPFSNLDKKRRNEIISYLLKINNQLGIPMLIISHDLEDILKLTQTLLIINEGKVAMHGNYLDIADSGVVPELISHKQYINILDLYHSDYFCDENLHGYAAKRGGEVIVKTNSLKKSATEYAGKKVRLCIFPDDVALTSEEMCQTSIQNQIKGLVTKIRHSTGSNFVTVDCGIDIVAEVTDAAISKMNISVNSKVYCLIKAKAINIVHIYK